MKKLKKYIIFYLVFILSNISLAMTMDKIKYDPEFYDWLDSELSFLPLSSEFCELLTLEQNPRENLEQVKRENKLCEIKPDNCHMLNFYLSSLDNLEFDLGKTKFNFNEFKYTLERNIEQQITYILLDELLKKGVDFSNTNHLLEHLLETYHNELPHYNFNVTFAIDNTENLFFFRIMCTIIGSTLLGQRCFPLLFSKIDYNQKINNDPCSDEQKELAPISHVAS